MLFPALLALCLAGSSAYVSLPFAKLSKSHKQSGDGLRRLAIGKVQINEFEEAQFYGQISLG